MPEVLVILRSSATDSQRAAVARTAPAAQTISDRVFTSVAGDAAIAQLRATPGIAAVLTGGESVQSLPQLSDIEMLFAQAWLSRVGQTKQRTGDGLKWDTPPMLPPDPPPQK
jgi:hypothetical protein